MGLVENRYLIRRFCHPFHGFRWLDGEPADAVPGHLCHRLFHHGYFYSAKDVAIWSMIPALSFDSEERGIMATFAQIGAVFGAQLIAVVVMPIVLFFSANGNSGAGDATGWFAFACIGGGIAILSSIVLALGTNEQSSALRENKKETSAKDVFRVLMHNDQLLWVALAYIIYGLGQNLVNNFNLYYFVYIVGDGTKYSYLGVIDVIIGLAAVALFPALTKNSNAASCSSLLWSS